MDNQNSTNYETVSQEVSDVTSEVSSAKFCPNCGAETKAEELFCNSCGTNLIDPSNAPPLLTKGKLKNFICEKKKLFIAIGVVIVAIAIIWVISFGIMCSVAKDNVVGVWTSESYTYAFIVSIDDDGTWLYAKARKADKTIVETESGSWDMKGMTAVLKGKNVTYRYKYHLSNELTGLSLNFKRLEN